MRPLLAALAIWAAGPAVAAPAWSGLIGYTVADVKTVVGYIEGGEKLNGYKGCRSGRVLVFDDGTGILCRSYGYAFAFGPEAVILVRDGSLKLIIEDDQSGAAPLR